MKRFHFLNSQEAYDKINEFFLNNKDEIEKRGGGRYGGQMVMYDVIIEIDKAWVNPKFDFGNMFGYRRQKWSGLLKNYLDPLDLKDLSHRVSIRLMKKTKNYTESMVFHNKHGHGKACLLSLTCVQRQDEIPVIHAHIRSSEITKRLLMDLLLIQRIGEQLYPTKFGIKVWVINIYQNAEAFTMLNNHIDIRSIVRAKDNEGFDTWQQTVLTTLNKFETCNIDDIKMKVHKRCVRQLQRPNGIPLSGDRPMLAKDLRI